MVAPKTFSKMQIVLHWLIAALVAYQILFSDGIEEVWRARMSGAAANEPSANPHVIVGVAILVLMLARLWLRFARGVPALPDMEHPLLRRVAALAHGLFYLLLIGLPVSGLIAWFGGTELPAEVHAVAGNLLIALIALHVAAALFHHFWLKSDVLKQIVRWGA